MPELWDDFTYSDVIRSDGFVVDYAVMTTYSLELPSLLSVPLTLGAMADLTDQAMRCPQVALGAVEKYANKFAVFCNAGSIAVPDTTNKIYQLLERNVVQVRLPHRGGRIVNFHPKVWVVKARNRDTGERLLTVVVSSRNLTRSNDLDTACALTGIVSPRLAPRQARAKHRPLGDFLAWLAARATSEIAGRIGEIIDDLNHVEHFELRGSPFADYEFFPMGIDGHDGETTCLEDMLDGAREIALVSPFVDDETLRAMASRASGSRKMLVTRYASVSEEALRLFDDGVYVPKEVLTSKMETDATVDLHEKVYLVGKETGYSLYVGSANATRNAFGRNVEFQLKLNFAPGSTSYDDYKDELVGDGEESPFELISGVAPLPEASGPDQDEQALRQAIAAGLTAEAQERDDLYDITVRCEAELLPKQGVTLYPLGLPAISQALAGEVTFRGIGLTMLTEWYVIGVGDIMRIIKIETVGIPGEKRDSAIFRSIIGSKGKFINFLAHMLTENATPPTPDWTEDDSERKADKRTEAVAARSVALYEDMVRMAHIDPERVAAIRKVIDKVDPSVIPDSFATMYATFEKAIKQIQHL